MGARSCPRRPSRASPPWSSSRWRATARPSASPSSADPVIAWRTSVAPSTVANSPWTVTVPRRRRGRRRSRRTRPPAASSRRPARPGSPARHRRPAGSSRSSIAASAARTAASSARHSTASAACADLREDDVRPAAARRCGRPRPSRSSAAAATTTASTPSTPGPGHPRRHVPPEPLEAQVGPRVRELRPAAQRPGGDDGALGEVGEARRRRGRRARRPARARRRSRARRGWPTAGPWPSGRRRRPGPSSTAACTSLTNTPLPPSSQMGTSSRRSPLVSTTTTSASTPGSNLCSSAATWSACQRASAEPRVAMRRRVTVPSGCPGAAAPVNPRSRTALAGPPRAGRRGRCPPRPSAPPWAGAAAWRRRHG